MWLAFDAKGKLLESKVGGSWEKPLLTCATKAVRVARLTTPSKGPVWVVAEISLSTTDTAAATANGVAYEGIVDGGASSETFPSPPPPPPPLPPRRASKPGSEVEIHDLTISGPLDHDTRRSLAEHTDEMKRCYLAARAKAPSLAATISLTFSVDARGTAKPIASTGPKPLVACASSVLTTLTFTRTGEGPAKATVEIVFGAQL